MEYEDKSKKQLINEINVLKLKLQEKELLLSLSAQKSKNEQSKRIIFLEGLLHSIPDMIFCKDVEGKYIDCNPVFSHFLRSSTEDILGKTDYDLFDKELADFFRGNDLKMIERGIPRTNEELLDLPEGSFLYDMLKAPLYTADGNIMGLIGIGRDITERKKAEAELIKQHDKMLSIFESIDEMVYVSDPNTYELLFANKFTRNFSREDIIGKKCHKILQNKDHPCSFCTNDKIFGEYIGKSYIWEYQNCTNERFYRCIDKAIEWPDGRMVRFEMAIDIHESKVAEKALRESETKFEIISTFANDAIISVNNEGCIYFWNKAAEELFGYSYEEALGKNIHSLIAPEKYRNMYEEGLFLFKETGKGSAIDNTIELTAHKKDGTEFLVELSLSATKLNNEWTAVSIIRDITERKAIEKKILQAKIDAEYANRTKSEFLANMSHELRTPLNSVIGFSDILLEGCFGELNEKQDKYLNNISNSGKHLLNIINTILDISKIESGTMDLYMNEIVVEDIVNEMVSLMQPLANKKKMKLKVSFMQNFECINADEAKLKQILYNLLGNAIKFTEDGGSVTIKTGNKGDLLTVSVIDTGIGIHSDDFNKLFMPFSQIESHTSRKYEGTGLGLALVKELVILHGGSIRVESKLQEGSNFIFTLPIGQKKSQIEV
jgi:two-component system cell cycle sensor histidine kinase PleC